MHKVIHSENIKQALQVLGWNQKDLATALGVTAQSVTNWLRGSDFPRPDKLLKLATTLQMGFADLVKLEATGQPVVAFRKKAGAKTTDGHISKAMMMGELLKALCAYSYSSQAPITSSYKHWLVKCVTAWVWVNRPQSHTKIC
jgi:transcriptional regulator with XRE-family HTH domain